MSKGLYNIEAVMRTLQNLQLGFDSFNLTDADQEFIKSKMAKCTKCRRWQFNADLDENCCLRCATQAPPPPKRLPKRPKALSKNWRRSKIKHGAYLQSLNCQATIFLSLTASINKGKNLEEALQDNSLTYDQFETLPIRYIKSLLGLI